VGCANACRPGGIVGRAFSRLAARAGSRGPCKAASEKSSSTWSRTGASRFRRREAPAPISCAITLEILEGIEWTTVHLWDNADDVDEHHDHAYTQEGGKQPPAILEFKSSNDAMAAAIRKPRRRRQRS
jgi:hypothetical protein